MEKFVKALGKVLVALIYVIIVVILIGFIKWLIGLFRSRSDD